MDKKAWILAVNSGHAYVDEVLDGVTTIKGSPCTIESITPSGDGRYNTVTFSWTGNSGTVYTEDMIVYNGMGIKSVEIDSSFHVIVTYDDDTTEDVGMLPTSTVEVGTTETVDFDEPAEVTQETTVTGIKLNFKIPCGEPGGTIYWHDVT